MQTSFYPGDLAARGAEMLRGAGDTEGGAVKYLRKTLNIQQVGYRDMITVRAPNPTEAMFFNIPADGRVGVFETLRTVTQLTGISSWWTSEKYRITQADRTPKVSTR
jgi:hypothetical protein